MGCPFCDTLSLNKRIFYCQEPDALYYSYFGFLAAPCHVKGHIILAALARSKTCPQRANLNTLYRLGSALSEVMDVIRKYYRPKDILLSSLRGDVKHFHIHLIPLYENEEIGWRKITNYENGHLMEFLGALERRSDYNVLRLNTTGVTTPQQRETFQNDPKTIADIKKIRKLIGYKGMHNNAFSTGAE